MQTLFPFMSTSVMVRRERCSMILAGYPMQSRNWGIPLLVMMYPRGEKIKDEYDVEVVKHAARVGCEMGADIVKVSYTGSPESFVKVVERMHGAVVIAGGAKMDSDRDILEMVRGIG